MGAENSPLKALSIFPPVQVRLPSGVVRRTDAPFAKREARAAGLLGDRGAGRAVAEAVGATFAENPGQFIVFSIKLGKVVTTAFPKLNQLFLHQYEPRLFASLCR